MDASRKLPIQEYLRVLQLEYFSNKLRGLIYEGPEFKKIKEDIAEKKKEKIIALAKKLELFSIFDSSKFHDSFLQKEFLREFGLPNLQYGPDENKNKGIAYWDKFYLFKAGWIVEYAGKDYKIQSNDPIKDTLIIVDREDKEIYFQLPYIYVKHKDLASLLKQDIKE